MYATDTWGYIAHPKTASSATSRVVRDLDAQVIGNHHSVDDRRCQRILRDGIIFATIRNPYDLMVSWYWHYEQRGRVAKTFPAWLRQHLANPNHYIRQGLFYGLKWANRVLRFEHLQEDFNCLMDELGYGRRLLHSFNVSHNRKGRPYQEFYDDQSKSLIEEHFAGELRAGDYAF